MDAEDSTSTLWVTGKKGLAPRFRPTCRLNICLRIFLVKQIVSGISSYRFTLER
jgi:hypothetical protein